MVIRDTKDVLLTGALGLVVPLQELPQGREGLLGISMGAGSLLRALAQGSTHQGQCEDRTHFVWDFFLPLVFVPVAL